MSNRIYHDLVAMVVTVGWWFYFLFYSSENKTHNDDASNWNIDFQVVDLHFLWWFYHFFAIFFIITSQPEMTFRQNFFSSFCRICFFYFLVEKCFWVHFGSFKEGFCWKKWARSNAVSGTFARIGIFHNFLSKISLNCLKCTQIQFSTKNVSKCDLWFQFVNFLTGIKYPRQ